MEMLEQNGCVSSGIFSGNVVSSEHPSRSRRLRCCNLKMLLGIVGRFLQNFKDMTLSPTRLSIDKGSSFIAVLFKETLSILAILSSMSGNFSSFEQPVRRRV
jgi:hypothetical protein